MPEPEEPPHVVSPLPVAPPLVPGGAPVSFGDAPAAASREEIAAAPPVWQSLLAPITGILAGVVAGSIALALVAVLTDGRRLTEGDFEKNFTAWYQAHVASFPVIFAAIVPAQIAFFGAAFLFALLDRGGWRPRLGMVGWKTPRATVALAVLGTLGDQFVIILVAGNLIQEPSETLKMLHRMFAEPQGIAAVGVGFLMSALPGVCEESLFRGFMQGGLLRRWHPAAAIGVSSLFFALAHFDSQHSPVALVFGIWLGFVAWRTGSVWPAALCHFTNNLVAFVRIRIGVDAEKLDHPHGAVYYAVGAILVAATILAASRLMREKPERA
jgi:membrane protease YdiL (CAAX protease family)